MTDYPDEEKEFHRCWSSKGGEVAALKRCQLAVETRSAAEFVRRQDQTANALRDAAAEIAEMVRKASKELEGYIEEDRRRRFELTKMLRH